MLIKLIEPIAVKHDLIEQFGQILESLGHQFIFYKTKATSEEEIIERAQEADILMIANTPLPDEVIIQAKNLKMINVAFTGFDHVNVKLASEKNILVCNASGYSSVSVSELVIGMTLSIFRMIRESDHEIRQGNTIAGYGYSGMEIKEKTIGIIGTGNIGVATAKLFLAFGGNVIAYSRNKNQELLALGVKYLELDELLSKSDIVSLHLALNPDTRMILDKNKLSLMKPGSILINTARGGLVDNSALADLLNNGKIGFAGIDVFDMEPPIPSDYPLLHAKHTLLAPHIGFSTKESMIRRAEIVFENTLAYLNNSPKNVVN